MNKEEMFKNLSDKDKKEVLSLISFMEKVKEQDRNKELYATYEEYLDLIHISESLSNENELLQSQLDIANNKLKEVEEYITLHATTTDDVNGWHTVLYDIEPLLSIIGGE